MESRFYEYDLDPSVLVDGTNIIAVEVHQSYANSPDLSFDLELKGIGGVSGELAVDQGTRIIARTLSGTSWSGITEAVTTVDGQLSGDLDGNGQVNSDDLSIVRANWGQAVPAGNLTMGDASGDGVVNGADLDIVRANWGAGTPSPAAARTDPEDSTHAPSSSFIGPRRESASDEALSTWTNPNSGHGLSDSDLASLAEAAWLQEIEGLRNKGKRRGVERGSLSEMVLMAE